MKGKSPNDLAKKVTIFGMGKNPVPSSCYLPYLLTRSFFFRGKSPERKSGPRAKWKSKKHAQRSTTGVLRASAVDTMAGGNWQVDPEAVRRRMEEEEAARRKKRSQETRELMLAELEEESVQ